MKLSKLELVRGIQAVLSDESKWCKGTSARDIQGRSVTVTAPEAVSFCVYGAGRKAANFGFGNTPDSPFWEVMREIGGYNPNVLSSGNISIYNDSHSYSEIMARLKEVEAKYAEEERVVRDAVAV